MSMQPSSNGIGLTLAPLLKAARDGDLQETVALLQSGADVEVINPKNQVFPLLYAAQNGHSEIVKALLEAGAAVDRIEIASGGFPLLMAAQNGHAEVVKTLIAYGADVDMTDTKSGIFPLLMAAQNGHAEVVKTLIACGADAEGTNSENGVFPLFAAVQNGHAEIVAALLEIGANPRRVHHAIRRTPVDLAVTKQDREILRMFRQHLETSAESMSDNWSTSLRPGYFVLQETSRPQYKTMAETLLRNLVRQADWPIRFDYSADWRLPKDSEAWDAMMSVVLVQQNGIATDATPIDLRVADLHFYPNLKLFEIILSRELGEDECLAILWDGAGCTMLDGTSPPIHAINAGASARSTLDLSSLENAVDYLKFYCAYVYGEEGPFLILESAAELGSTLSQKALGEVVTPVEFNGMNDLDDDCYAYLFTAVVSYGGHLFRAQFKVSIVGIVEMTDDYPILTEFDVPKHAFLNGPGRVRS